MDLMLQVEGLTKRFGLFTAVDSISFNVNRGEVLGFLGPNGAGKTTAMRMVAGFLTPSAGTAYVGGYDVITAPLEVKRSIGYLPEGAPLYEDMTPLELLDFIANVRGLTGIKKQEALTKAAERINIEHVMHQAIGTLSKGYKRRVGIAQAILHDPEILILDEPTDGLDPNQKHEVRKLINEMATEKAIVISTHLLDEVDTVCTRALVIANGEIVADGTPADLEARSVLHNAVTLRIPREHFENAKSSLEEIKDVKQVSEEKKDGTSINFIVYPVDGRLIVDEVSAALRGSNIDVQEIRSERGRLDEVFRRITTKA